MKHWYLTDCPAPSKAAFNEATARQAELTKPLGSLGKLEEIAQHFAAWQGTVQPSLNNIMIRVFAGDHGVCEQGVSAFPQEVTMQMVMNFIQGGAAISVLSKQEKADFAVVNMGLVTPLPPIPEVLKHPKLINVDIAPGTKDFSQQAAMTETECLSAIETGKNSISNSQEKPDLFIGGEMGIGNTSAASAIYCAILGITAIESAGPGTGVDEKGVLHKAKVIDQALKRHKLDSSHALADDASANAFEVLRTVGGLEIAALTGAYISAAQNSVPSMVDGFICTAAALLAIKLNPSCRDWLMFSHQSAEPAHKLALAHLKAETLIDLGMRLGEGSGAAVCIPLLRTAINLHNNMATFAEAAVTGQSNV